jgi:hypothetical protein
MEDTLRFAGLAGVKHLLLAHHDPVHTDVQLNGMFESLKSTHRCNFEYELAVEGKEFDLA